MQKKASRPHRPRCTDALKRLMDVIGAAVGLVLAAPLILAAAVAVKLDSPGPAFFLQKRVGKNGRRFSMIKLRTMVQDAERMKAALLAENELHGGCMFKLRRDPRVTRVGAFLRRSSIDELPQLVNVLLGHMSLVGARPPTEDEVLLYRPEHWRRLAKKPGITGLWQISGRSAITSFEQVVALDASYIESHSLLLDIKILLRTLPAVLRGRGAY